VSSASEGEIAFLDTNIFIRYLTRDDPDKAARAYALLLEVERGERLVMTTEAVLTEVVHVLSSKALYNVPRQIIRQRLYDLLALSGLRLRDKRTYRRALDLYAQQNLDFVDCLIVAQMERAKVAALISFDRGFDWIPGITRVEP